MNHSAKCGQSWRTPNQSSRLRSNHDSGPGSLSIMACGSHVRFCSRILKAPTDCLDLQPSDRSFGNLGNLHSIRQPLLQVRLGSLGLGSILGSAPSHSSYILWSDLHADYHRRRASLLTSGGLAEAKSTSLRTGWHAGRPSRMHAA